jgi:GNAT superfamily N-acetyltransferase
VSETIILEHAFPGHAWEISRLVNSVFRGENSKKGWTTEADLLDGIRINVNSVFSLIGRKDSELLIAKVNGGIIGCVHIQKKPGKKGYLGMLSVDVDYQGKGIGNLLMTESERYSKDIFGCSSMEIKVFEKRPELVDYYLRRGYISTGEKTPFIVNVHFGIPRVNDDDLNFIFMEKKL